MLNNILESERNRKILAFIIIALAAGIFGFIYYSEQDNSTSTTPTAEEFSAQVSPDISPTPTSSLSPSPTTSKEEYPDADKIEWAKEPKKRPPQPTVLPDMLAENYVRALFSTDNSDGKANSTVSKWISPQSKKRDLPSGPPPASREGRISTTGEIIDMEYKQDSDYFLVRIEMKETFDTPPTIVTTSDIYLGLKLAPSKDGVLVLAAQYLGG